MKLDKEGNIRWSQLPTLVLWMVKDRLNFVDNVRLAAVCKDWNLASQSYPSKSQQCVTPVLMHQIPNSTLCVFTKVPTMQTNHVLHLPEFHDGTTLLFSRQGWLFLQESCKVAPGQPPESSVVLLHLQTNAKILMPTPEDDMKGFSASFSSFDDGTPSCLIFVNCVETQITLYVANAGDKKWTKHSYGNGRGKYITASIFRGDKIYCLDKLGGLFIFDMNILEWREVPGKTKQCYMMEYEEGEIVKVDECAEMKTFRFFKLNDKQTGWEELTKDDIMGRSWFLSSTVGTNNNLTVMKTARIKKVYRLSTFCKQGHDSEFILGTDIGVHDLISGSMRTIKINENGQWIDLDRSVVIGRDDCQVEGCMRSLTSIWAHRCNSQDCNSCYEDLACLR